MLLLGIWECKGQQSVVSVVVVMFQAVVAVEQGSGSVGGSNQCQRRGHHPPGALPPSATI